MSEPTLTLRGPRAIAEHEAGKLAVEWARAEAEAERYEEKFHAAFAVTLSTPTPDVKWAKASRLRAAALAAIAKLDALEAT